MSTVGQQFEQIEPRNAKRKNSVEVEGYFDGLAHRSGLAVGSQSRPEAPGADSLYGFLIEAKTQALWQRGCPWRGRLP